MLRLVLPSMEKGRWRVLVVVARGKGDGGLEKGRGRKGRGHGNGDDRRMKEQAIGNESDDEIDRIGQWKMDLWAGPQFEHLNLIKQMAHLIKIKFQE